ncbi:MAG TPA: hypothetical protein PLK80_17005 [bacterium]|nr:hypothetical protein [bacterium]
MNFYIIDNPKFGQSDAITEYLAVEPYNLTDDAPRCPSCGGYYAGRTWLPPYRVKIETWGKDFGDIVFGTLGDGFVVSEKFRDLYLKSKLSGLDSFHPVEIARVVKRGKRFKKDVPTYYYAPVARTTAAVDILKSEIERGNINDICPDCLYDEKGLTKRWKRVVLKEGTWKGEEIFEPKGLRVIIVTASFKLFCEENDILNAVFIPAEEYAHDFYPWENIK